MIHTSSKTKATMRQGMVIILGEVVIDWANLALWSKTEGTMREGHIATSGEMGRSGYNLVWRIAMRGTQGIVRQEESGHDQPAVTCNCCSSELKRYSVQ